MAQGSSWPTLPTAGFIKGRPAVRSDVAAGVAAFTLQLSDGRSAGVPLDMAIPQYAIWHDQKSRTDVPVIIIQAESRGSLRIVGYRRASGGGIGVALQTEFTLLGTDRAKLPSI